MHYYKTQISIPSHVNTRRYIFKKRALLFIQGAMFAEGVTNRVQRVSGKIYKHGGKVDWKNTNMRFLISRDVPPPLIRKSVSLCIRPCVGESRSAIY